MMHYKKRTIALCLASVLTVVGAFGAGNYNNRLMSLGINNNSNIISLTAFTEKPLNIPLRTVKENDNTFSIIIPESDSTAAIPNIANCPNIESINISTLPYTYEQLGYTKVTVRTVGMPLLETKSTLFISDLNTQTTETPSQPSYDNKPSPKKSYWDVYEDEDDDVTPQKQYNYQTPAVRPQPQPQPQPQPAESNDYNIDTTANNTDGAQGNPAPAANYNTSNNYNYSHEPTVAIICGSILLLIIGFIFLAGKDKMASVVGEQHQIDFNDDKDNKKSRKKEKSRKTNPLEETSLKNINPSAMNINNTSDTESPQINSPKEEEEEEITVVNLDELYQEKTQSNNIVNEVETAAPPLDEADDLADFLNEFTFNEETETTENEEEGLFDEGLYQEVISSTELKFTKADIERLNQLLRLEISPETQTTLAEHIKAALAKPKPLTKKQIFEDLVTTYSIKQNITFSNDDINTIKNLMDVELDKNFITDLRTKPGRAKEAEKEIKAQKQNKTKKSDIITLSVKDLLPDLSKELQKQGNKKIESEVKPQVVYYSEGYEYTKLSVSDDLADLSAALQSKDATEHKESYFAPIVEDGYEVSTLSIKDELPDLEDVKANPEKYQDKKVEQEKVDENALLKSIANVTFKPFYEEVQEELNQFEGFEIINREDDIINIAEEPQKEINNAENTNPEDFVFVNEPTIQTPESSTADIIESEPQVSEIVPVSINTKPVQSRRTKINDDAQRLLKLIEAQQIARQNKKIEETAAFKQELESASGKTKTKVVKPEPDLPKIKPEDNNNEIIKTILINNNTECSLVKTDDGYEIIGCIKDKQFNLKHYDSLKSTNMQIRAHQKNKQYLIKLGIHKFVINIYEDNMEFVMDLC